jgi:hypothetical protein
VANNPAKYGVKWFVTRKDYYGLPSSWDLVSQEENQSKWLWETNIQISLVDVIPFGNGSLDYITPNKLQVILNTNETTVDILIKVAHHPSWKIQENANLSIEREEEIGFMLVKNVSSGILILNFESNHVDIVFAGFIINLIIIAVLSIYEYKIPELMRKKLNSQKDNKNNSL